MKNTLTTLLLLGAFTVNAQLNSNAQTLKDADSIEYRLLKKYAEQEWGEDYEMIVYTINEHADAMREVVDIMSEGGDNMIMFSAFKKWSDNSIRVEGKSFVDYTMVLYTYKEQLEAKNSY